MEIGAGTLVLLGGYRCHGKDTFYRHLSKEQADYAYDVRLLGQPFCFPDAKYRRVAFADSLKEECAALLGMTVDEVNEKKDLPCAAPYAFKCTTPYNDPPTVRDVLIDHGAYARSLDPDHYPRRIFEQLDPGCVTVVTDFRFKNEYDFFARHGVQVVTAWLRRDGAAVPAADIHSEHALDDFHFQIQIKCCCAGV